MGCIFGLDMYIGTLCIGDCNCDKASSSTVVAENGCDSGQSCQHSKPPFLQEML